MNILVVNDDGIEAEGLKKLATSLKRYGNVVVVAPSEYMSAYSHTITLYRGLKVEKVSFGDGIPAYKVDGTPADCVKIGLSTLNMKFHLVASGINNGLNVGADIVYSGTVSAAVEANIQGVPSFAISTPYNSFEIVEQELDDLLTKIMYSNVLSNEYALNINFPAKGYLISNGIRITEQGKRSHSCKYRIEKGLYYADENIIKYDERKSSDVFAITNGYISVTPITQNHTDYMSVSKLSHLNSR